MSEWKPRAKAQKNKTNTEKTVEVIDKEVIAEMCHEANRVWCRMNGDDSQPSWFDAPDWQRALARMGVEFHLTHLDAGDDASHQNWMDQKVAEGWVYGEVKNPNARPPTHPCIVPFSELPMVQQKKDAIFRALVHALK